MQELPFVELRNVEKRFGATHALRGVNVDIRAGEVHALLGENGAGKSTLMAVLAGLVPPDGGTMRLSGKPYRPASARDARRLGVALVTQEHALCMHLTVAENIALGREHRRGPFIDRARIHDEARTVLEPIVAGGDRLNVAAPVGQLSPAQRQKVDIARALALRARVLVLDEPTTSLGKADVDELFRVLERLRSEGIAIVYISHFLEEVRRIAQTFTVLRDGASVATGALSDIGDGELARHMSAQAPAGPKGEATSDEASARSDRSAAVASGTAALEVRDLRVAGRIGRASFVLRRGEALGIAGLVGSGRTELLRALMGLDRSFGSVLVHGEEVSRATVAERIARGLSLVSEDRKEEGLLLGRSIAENTVLARPKSATRGPFLSPSRMAEAAVRFIERLAIRTSGPQAPVGTLSGGNQQKVQFARVLHAGANVLLLDEPTRGIDLGAKAALFDLLAQLRAEGAAVLMVSSALPELLSHCDSIALLRGGILAQPTPASEWTEPLLLEALLSAPASGALAGGEHSVGPPSSGAAGASASHGPSTEADA